jgi:hypothetical protein
VLLVSEKVSQKTLPLEFFRACCLKFPAKPRALVVGSIIMMSSLISSRLSCVARLGLDKVVDGPDCGGGCRGGSRSMSLSRTWRTTSASRRNSDSTGALSSARAARMRANPFVLG